jgi:hypothetical protein
MSVARRPVSYDSGLAKLARERLTYNLLRRPCEVLSGILNPAILEVAHHSPRGFLQNRHVLVSGFAQFGFGPHWHALAHLLLQVRVDSLFKVELPAVARQIKEGN